MSLFDWLITKLLLPNFVDSQCQLHKSFKTCIRYKSSNILINLNIDTNSLHVPNERPKDKGKLSSYLGTCWGTSLGIIKSMWKFTWNTKIQKNTLFPPSLRPLKGKKTGPSWMHVE